MSTRTRRQYTRAERQAAIRDAAEMGVCAAARKHGIAASCVSRWASEARLRKRSRGAVAQTPPRKSRGAEAKPSAWAKAKPKVSAKPPRASSSSKRRVVKRYTPSQKAEVLEYAGEHGVTAAAAKFEV